MRKSLSTPTTFYLHLPFQHHDGCNNNLTHTHIFFPLSPCSRVAEPAAAPTTCSTMPTRVSRGAAAQAGALAKVTQVARVQRSKARIERRHLGRNRLQRQNLTREQVPRHAAHTRNTFLHQPSKRNVCH